MLKGIKLFCSHGYNFFSANFFTFSLSQFVAIFPFSSLSFFSLCLSNNSSHNNFCFIFYFFLFSFNASFFSLSLHDFFSLCLSLILFPSFPLSAFSFSLSLYLAHCLFLSLSLSLPLSHCFLLAISFCCLFQQFLSHFLKIIFSLSLILSFSLFNFHI